VIAQKQTNVIAFMLSSLQMYFPSLLLQLLETLENISKDIALCLLHGNEKQKFAIRQLGVIE